MDKWTRGWWIVAHKPLVVSEESHLWGEETMLCYATLDLHDYVWCFCGHDACKLNDTCSCPRRLGARSDQMMTLWIADQWTSQSADHAAKTGKISLFSWKTAWLLMKKLCKTFISLKESIGRKMGELTSLKFAIWRVSSKRLVNQKTESIWSCKHGRPGDLKPEAILPWWMKARNCGANLFTDTNRRMGQKQSNDNVYPGMMTKIIVLYKRIKVFGASKGTFTVFLYPWHADCKVFNDQLKPLSGYGSELVSSVRFWRSGPMRPVGHWLRTISVFHSLLFSRPDEWQSSVSFSIESKLPSQRLCPLSDLTTFILWVACAWPAWTWMGLAVEIGQGAVRSESLMSKVRRNTWRMTPRLIYLYIAVWDLVCLSVCVCGTCGKCVSACVRGTASGMFSVVQRDGMLKLAVGQATSVCVDSASDYLPGAPLPLN